MLAISWGKDIFLFVCENVEEEEDKRVKFVVHYCGEAEIFHLEWLSKNNILTYDDNKDFKVVSTELFSIPGAKNNFDYDYNTAVISSKFLDPDIGYQKYSHDKSNYGVVAGRQQRPILYYTNTIAAYQANNCVFMFGEKKIYHGVHHEWKEYINTLISNAEWQQALSIFASIYKSEKKLFAGVPPKTEEGKKEFWEEGVRRTRAYINSIRNIRGSPDPNSPTADQWRTDIWSPLSTSRTCLVRSRASLQSMAWEVRLWRVWSRLFSRTG